MTQLLWRKYAEWPLLAVAAVFLTAYSAQVILDLPPEHEQVLELVVWTTWGVFGMDYLANLVLASNRRRWFMRNLHELVILLLPVLRPLRLLRLVTLLRVLHRSAGSSLRGRVLTYVLGTTLLLIYVGAVAILDAEKDAEGSNIASFGDALWWAVVTISTVGYGDHFPVTPTGRLVAVALLLTGVAVLGVITAAVASWLVEAVSTEVVEEPGASDEILRREVAMLSEQIQRLNARLELQSPDQDRPRH